MERYEIQKLRDLPIEGVAERLGLRVMRHKSLCPFHQDHHPSLSFSTRRNTFRCFVCGAHGDTITLAMRMLNKGFFESCHWLADENGVILSEYRPQTEAEDKEYHFDAQRYGRFFVHPFLSEAAREFLFDVRRLDPRVVKWCRLASWRDKDATEWLQIPYFDQDGRLTGIQNRNLSIARGSRQPRFRFPRGARCGIYNLPVVKLLAPAEPLYIAEGSSDCWSLLSAGHKAIAIPSATLLKADEVRLLAQLHKEMGTPLHMFPDKDAPGELLFAQLDRLLAKAIETSGESSGETSDESSEHVLIHHQLPAGCKDYSDYYMKRKEVDYG